VGDGVYFHQYDAWGRLWPVWAPGTLEFDADGEAVDGEAALVEWQHERRRSMCQTPSLL
jgi:hypothetical protein